MGTRTNRAWLLDGPEKKASSRGKASSSRGKASSSKGKAGSGGQRGNAGRTSRQWLAVPKPSERSEDAKPAAGDRKKPKRGAIRERRSLIARLRHAEGTVDAQAREIQALRAEVSDLNRKLKSSGSRRGGSTRAGTRPSKNGARGSRGRADLNSVTFEELRELGLSVTQSARLIGARESRGGFDSDDDLDRVPGFSRQIVAELKSSLPLRPRS